jgi:hypothetical protein
MCTRRDCHTEAGDNRNRLEVEPQTHSNAVNVEGILVEVTHVVYVDGELSAQRELGADSIRDVGLLVGCGDAAARGGEIGAGEAEQAVDLVATAERQVAARERGKRAVLQRDAGAEMS